MLHSNCGMQTARMLRRPDRHFHPTLKPAGEDDKVNPPYPPPRPPRQSDNFNDVWRRALHLQTLEQEEMIAVRAAWFEEVGGPPPGNKRAHSPPMHLPKGAPCCHQRPWHLCVGTCCRCLHLCAVLEVRRSRGWPPGNVNGASSFGHTTPHPCTAPRGLLSLYKAAR